MFRAAAVAGLLCLTPMALAQDAQQRIEWNRPAEPFRIIGNVYYVGTDGLAAYLIADPKGLVLIDGGLPESAPLIRANIEKLGFRMRDIKYLLLNHSHFDHSGGLAALKQASGAQMVASAGDAPDLRAGKTVGRPELGGFPPVKVDRIATEGSWIRVGGTTLVAHLTPGHTRGCTSWSLRTTDAGRAIEILFACSLTVAGQPLTGSKTYPQATQDFRMTFAKLKRIKADVFLNFHPGFFDLKRKRAKQKAGDAFAFVDAAELGRQVAQAERGFEAELAAQKAPRKR